MAIAADVFRQARELDGLRQAERAAFSAVERQQQAALDARQAQERAQAELRTLQNGARGAFVEAQRAQELRVFGYRLALTLPLLVLAGYLFKKHRKGSSWPFVWGFIFFALFAFFVELVPYLPSYGGYVRYIVGIVLTVIGGRYAIRALQRYLERQQQAEALPDRERRRELDYDLALTRLAKGVCPGCERAVDLKDPKNDFCPHCGMGLHNHCTACQARKSAFARYCYSCGEPARAEPVAAVPHRAAGGTCRSRAASASCPAGCAASGACARACARAYGARAWRGHGRRTLGPPARCGMCCPPRC